MTAVHANEGEETAAAEIESTGKASPKVGESLPTNFDYRKDYPSLKRSL